MTDLKQACVLIYQARVLVERAEALWQQAPHSSDSGTLKVLIQSLSKLAKAVELLSLEKEGGRP